MPVKFRNSPGARFVTVSSGVLFVGRLLKTCTLVRVILPALLTVPENVATLPGATGLGGQCLTRASLGVVIPGQSLKSVAVTIRPKHLSAPLAITVSRYGPHESKGTTYRSVNGTLAPGGKLIGPTTKWLWLIAASTLVTVTFSSVILPAFETTPLMISVPPGGTGSGGQLFFTVIAGEFVPGQLLVSLLVTVPMQTLLPKAVSVSG